MFGGSTQKRKKKKKEEKEEEEEEKKRSIYLRQHMRAILKIQVTTYSWLCEYSTQA